MSSIDANTLSDPQRVRRTELAERHAAATRAVVAAERANDKKALEDAQRAVAAAEEEIAAEYAEDLPQAEPPAPSGRK